MLAEIGPAGKILRGRSLALVTKGLLVHPLQAQIADGWPPERWRQVGVICAVSGGADSVALAYALQALHQQWPAEDGPARGALALAHLNHRLRGEESDADQTFVEQLAERLQLPCHSATADIASAAADQGDGIEAAARSARYAFLQRVAEQQGARYVVTAHTADDQAETVLHHLLRGTGLAGLAGMPMARPLGNAVSLVRPLLAIKRATVLDYLQTRGADWREDASNAERGFLRNRLRLDLLPLLEREYAAGVRESLCRLAQQAADAQLALAPEVARLVSLAVKGINEPAAPAGPTEEQSGLVVSRAPLAGAARHLVREVFIAAWRNQAWPLQAMGYAEWEELAAMLLDDDSPAVRMFPGKVRVAKTPGALMLTRGGCE